MIEMEFKETEIEGVYVVKPRVFKDARGYFFESYSKREFDEHVGRTDFVQDNESCSTRGVVRGLHFQKPPYAQAKLVRCVRGAVVDVAVDLRKGSKTYGKHVAVELSEDNGLQLFVPRGFAHGFAVLTDVAVFQYKCDNYYCKESEGGISVTSEGLGIEWPFDPRKGVLSEKDTKYPEWKDFVTPFE